MDKIAMEISSMSPRVIKIPTLTSTPKSEKAIPLPKPRGEKWIVISKNQKENPSSKERPARSDKNAPIRKTFTGENKKIAEGRGIKKPIMRRSKG